MFSFSKRLLKIRKLGAQARLAISNTHVAIIMGLSLCLLLVNCATTTPRYDRFAKVYVGMTKTTVVESVGGPDHAVRLDGKIRWIYVFYNDKENPIQRELQFEDGKVSYIGPVTKPVISADEQDRINQAANDAEELRLEKEEDANSKRLGRLHLKSARHPNEPDTEDEEAENGKKKLIVAPTFQPVE